MTQLFDATPAKPPKTWEKFHQDWQASDLSPHFYQAMVNVGGGIHLCVEAGGDPENPPLLFITGFGSQMMFWSDTFLKKFMDAGFFVIRFDNRDTGLSTKINHLQKLPRTNIIKMMAKNSIGLSNAREKVAYTLFDMADDVAGLICAMNLGKANIIGASMGGMIAQILSAKYPQLVDRLVLLFSSTNQAFARLPKPVQFSTFFRKPQSHSERDMVRHAVWFMTAVGSPGHLDIKGTRAVAHTRYQRNFHPLGMAQQMNAILATGSIASYTKQITAPTLVIHGNKDGLLHQSHGRHIAKTIKNSKFELIDGMAHDLPMYYQPYLVSLIKNHCLG